ncbi:CoA transferase, partial [Burkholderia cenocepacia]|uniref:CoA transferase n=1 Tax=Burkholderia cenocepacia TaxID=95486 RepID=UPI0038CBF9E5
GYYEAADGRWLTLIGEFYVDDQWRRVARACQLAEAQIEDARFHSIEGLREHTEETGRLLADAIARFPRDEIIARFEAEDVLVAPVHEYEDVFVDPQVQHNRLVLEGEIAELGTVRFVGMPIALSETPAQLRRTPPKVGEH